MPRKNSKAKADAGDQWIEEDKPAKEDTQEVIDTLYLYGYYWQKWGKRVHDALHHLGGHTIFDHPPKLPRTARGGGKGDKSSNAEILGHLDPPPPPWLET